MRQIVNLENVPNKAASTPALRICVQYRTLEPVQPLTKGANSDASSRLPDFALGKHFDLANIRIRVAFRRTLLAA